MDTAWKVSQLSEKLGYPLTCVGIPKTVDNDLPHTDAVPVSVRSPKYVATSMREAGFDVASMAATSTKVSSWKSWAPRRVDHGGLRPGQRVLGQPPHILLFPEIPFDEAAFLGASKPAWPISVIAPLRSPKGCTMPKVISRRTWVPGCLGHAQLGGVGQVVAQLVKDRLGLKYHWALPDYLQRSARHLASKTDVEQAYALGKAAVELAAAGRNAVMPAIVRLADAPYRWEIGVADLAERGQRRAQDAARFHQRDDGFQITDKCRAYLAP